jgi:hypothetical protein
MLSRTVRGGLAALIIATSVTWEPPAAVALEPLGTECDYKVGINETEPIDDGIRFYAFQLIREVGSGFPPGAAIELDAITPITEPGPFQMAGR